MWAASVLMALPRALEASVSTWGGGQVDVAQSWRWLRSGCPPLTLGSQLRAMSVPPGGFSPCRPWRARTLEPSGRGRRDARGSAWDPSLPAWPSAGTELWKRSDFLIPGFRQGFFFGSASSASLLPFSAAADLRADWATPRHGGLPAASISTVSITHPNVPEGPRSWRRPPPCFWLRKLHLRICRVPSGCQDP